MLTKGSSLTIIFVSDMTPTATEETPVLPPEVPLPKLTWRQRAYKLNRQRGMSPENSAVSAGYSESYARAKSSKIERYVNIGMISELERAGATDRFLAKQLTTIAAAVPEGPITFKEKLRAIEDISKIKKHITDQPLPDPAEKTILVVLTQRVPLPAQPVPSSYSAPEIILTPRGPCDSGNGSK